MKFGGSLTAVVLTAAVCLGIGAGGTALFLTATPPPDLSASPSASSIALSLQQFNDSRSVQVTLDQQAGLQLITSATGVLTESSCQNGASVTSGSVPWSANEQPIVALHTAVLLYRDLKVGDTGRDVRALQEELHRLAVGSAATGTLTSSDTAAFDKLASTAAGAALAAGAISRRNVVWIPMTTTPIAQCQAQIGSDLTAQLALTSPATTAGRIVPMPTGLLPGTRTLTVDGTPINVDPSGRIEDDTALAKLLATPTGQAAAATISSQSPVPLIGTLALNKPLMTASIPASAVIESNGTTCVIDAGESRRSVAVVSSQLGRSIVSFTSTAAPPTSVQVNPPANATCS